MVAQNAIDPTLFDGVESREQARARLGLPHDAKIAMYVGSLERWKGVETLCKAGARMPSVQVVIIGGKREELEVLRARYPSVLFLGPRPYYELPHNQQAADVLVVPNDPVTTESEVYTSPIKLFAHMASGVPTLVSDLPSMRAIAGEDLVSFFEAGNPEALARKVMQMVNDDDAVARATKAREWVRDHTWQKRACSILGLKATSSL